VSMRRVLASWGERCRLAFSRFWERYVIKDKLIDGHTGADMENMLSDI
jgi:hypothetical protein